MSECGDFLLRLYDFTTKRAFYSLGKSGFGTCRSFALDFLLRMTDSYKTFSDIPSVKGRYLYGCRSLGNTFYPTCFVILV